MKRRLLLVFSVVLGALALSAMDAGLARTENPGAGATGTRLPVIVHRGTTLPPPAQAQPVPLVIALHPSGGTPAGFETATGLDAVADQHGFVVAYLAAPAPTSPAWTLTDMPANLAYVSSEINQLTADQNIDPNRVYVTGFSAGASMSFFVGCQLSGQVAAIAVVSGWMRVDDPCQLAHPVSELNIVGTKDGQPLGGTARLMSVEAVATRWRLMDSCTSQSSSAPSGPVTETTWSSCNDSSGVGLNVIEGGTHQWPGAPQATGADTQYNAAQIVWAFFAAHPGTPTTSVSAKFSSLTVGHFRLKRWVRATLSVGEQPVTLRMTLSGHGRLVASKPFLLARSPQDLVVFPLPVNLSGGRYSLKLSLADSYARRMTVVRTVTVPKQPH